MVEGLETIITIAASVVGSFIAVSTFADKMIDRNIHAVVDKMLAEQVQISAKQEVMLDKLGESIHDLSKTIATINEKQDKLNYDFVTIKNEVDALHRRMDDMDRRHNSFVGFCQQTHQHTGAPMPPAVYDELTRKEAT